MKIIYPVLSTPFPMWFYTPFSHVIPTSFSHAAFHPSLIFVVMLIQFSWVYIADYSTVESHIYILLSDPLTHLYQVRVAHGMSAYYIVLEDL